MPSYSSSVGLCRGRANPRKRTLSASRFGPPGTISGFFSGGTNSAVTPALVLKSSWKPAISLTKKLQRRRKKYFRWCSIAAILMHLNSPPRILLFGIPLCAWFLTHVPSCMNILCKSAVLIRRWRIAHVRREAASCGGENLSMNYSSNALQISLENVGRYDGSSQTEGRRTWHRGVISDKAQARQTR